MIADLWQDLRYAARMLRKNPGFTAVAVLTLALGIGVNTAFFTMFSAASHPLPVTDPETVVEVDLGDNRRASLPEYVYFRDRSNVFSGLTAGSASQRVVVGDELTSEQPDELYAQFVSENFFSLLC